MISAQRILILVLATLFSSYHIVLGIHSLGIPDSPWPALTGIVLYSAASALSLWPSQHAQMPRWLALSNILVGVLMTVLVLSQLNAGADNGYATWPVAAFATLMVITAVRRQPVCAWVGMAALGSVVTIWAGPLALTTVGVIGGAVWVGVAHALVIALQAGVRDAQQFEVAGRSAQEWQARQEAMLFERHGRLVQMNRLSAPMLQKIMVGRGQLSEEDRRECLLLEAAIRDEIRGRRLLSGEVRAAIMAARRRGIDVALLDDGGLDDLNEPELDLVLGELAEEIGKSAAERLVIRTGSARSTTAITVVGLTAVGDGLAIALGTAADSAADSDADLDAVEDQLDVWREIPRPLAHTRLPAEQTAVTT
jgi:hypothetical protein